MRNQHEIFPEDELSNHLGKSAGHPHTLGMTAIVPTARATPKGTMVEPADGPASSAREDQGRVSGSSVFVLALWSVSLTVGVLGLALPYSRPKPPAKEPPPLVAEVLNVELTNDPLPPVQDAPPPPLDPAQPPPLFAPQTPPQAPSLVAVAEASPAIAFALPVEGPVKIVEAKEATYVRQTEAPQVTPAPAPAPPVQSIVFGQGEGRQPAPEYPRQAMREGQEGSVVVRFSVGENGRVLSAEAATPCPWPLLNESALRAVRQRWRFAQGPIRIYEVTIRFALTR